MHSAPKHRKLTFPCSLPSARLPVIPTRNPGPEGPAFDFFCPTEYGLYMDPEDCSFYYSCNYWMAVHMPCYTDLVFNPETSMCDYRKYVPSCL